MPYPCPRTVAWTVFLATLLALGLPSVPATGQVRVAKPSESGGVALTLKDAPNGVTSNANSLPKGTRVVVLSAEKGEAHTLDNLYVSRDTLAAVARRAVEANRVDVLDASGRTRAYLRTPDAGYIYYVLAQKPDGTLYESRVNAGASGFVAGFDAVYSGHMAVGPVPEAAQETTARVFAPTGAEARALASDDSTGNKQAEGGWRWLDSLGVLFVAIIAVVGGTYVWRRTQRKRQDRRRDREMQTWGPAPVPGARRQQQQQQRSEPFRTHSNDDSIRLVKNGQGASPESLQAMERDEVEDRLQDSEREIRKMTEGPERVTRARGRRRSEAPSAHDASEAPPALDEAERARGERDAPAREAASSSWSPLADGPPAPPRPRDDADREAWTFPGGLFDDGVEDAADDPPENEAEGDAAPADPAPAPADAPPSALGNGAPGNGAPGALPSESAVPPEEVVHDAFLAWCAQGGAMLRHAHAFEDRLQRALPGATVETMACDASGDDVTLWASDGGAAAYWLVRHRATAWLYPYPTARGFRRVAPCFRGDATPNTLRDVRPATIEHEGEGVRLTGAGRLRTGTTRSATEASQATPERATPASPLAASGAADEGDGVPAGDGPPEEDAVPAEENDASRSAAIASSNFAFLASYDAGLHALGVEAEELLLRGYPVTCLARLRTFGEILTRRMVRDTGADPSWAAEETSQYDRITLLYEHGFMPYAVGAWFHSIRIAGNEAVHYNEGDHDEAISQLERAWQAARWAFKEAGGLVSSLAPFSAPEPSDSTSGDDSEGDTEAPMEAPADEGDAEAPTEAPADGGADAALIAQVGAAYVAWCQRGARRMAQARRFERHLRSTWPDARVSPIHQDTPVSRTRFTYAPRHSTARVYWHVEVDTTHVLVPRPAPGDVDARVFDGPEAFDPGALQSCRPAPLQPDGAAYALQRQGTLA